MTVADDEALVREALRVYRRYAEEFVEAFDLCPWVKGARRTGRVVEEVSLVAEPDVAALAAETRRVTSRDEIEVGLLILPRLALGRRDFERLVGAVREAGDPGFAAAAFHPDADPVLDDAMRLVPFIRRTPDPTIQLVRLEMLDRLRKSDKTPHYVDPATIDWSKPLPVPETPLHERVADDNLETITRVGVERAHAILADIHRDRDESYARLAAGRP